MFDRPGDPDRVGQQIGHYRLLTLLSTGTDASIYLAEHMHLATQVAVKLYQTRLLYSDQEHFLQELRAVAHLVHPHIMRILDFGMQDDTPFLVIPYTPGGTLRQRYPAGSTLPMDTIISSAQQLATALDYAHSQRVLHLNIKPEHMWLGRNNDILLSDFRITLFSHSSHSQNIQEVVDMASSMAPEQIQGYACPASDQYALGIVVYEWLCGSRPFSSTNYVEIARQQLHAPPPPLTARVQGVSPAVEQVVMRALAKDAAQRFPTVQAFAGALEQSLLNRRGSTSIAPATAGSLERSPSALSEAGEGNQQVPHLLSRRSVTLGAAGLVGAAAVAGGVSWLLRPSAPMQPHLPARPALPATTLHTCRGHVDRVYAAAWSRDGKSIASWSRDDTMRTWNATTFSPVNIDQMASVLSWSPDWRYIASGDAYGFQLWDATTGRLIVVQEFPNTGAGPGDLPADGGLWSPDGKYFATPLFYTQVWDVTVGKLLSSYPAGAVAWSPDGKRIALAPQPPAANPNTPPRVQILEVATENQLASYTLPRAVNPGGLFDAVTLVWSPDGKYLASANGDIWDAMTGQHIATYKGPLLWAFIAWSPDSKRLASVGYLPSAQQAGKPDNAVHIWSAVTGDEVLIYRGHTAAVNYLVWSPDGTKIASVSDDTTVQVWQAV